MKPFIIALLSLAVIATDKSEPIPVRVAAYEYPPYYSAESEHHLVGDITKALNRAQSKYHFTVERIAPNARYDALSIKGCCDVMLFEDISWGWQAVDYSIQLTDIIYKDQERFVARKAINRDQSFFEINGLRFGGIIGYHYPFAANEKDNRVLEEKYGIYLAHSHKVNLRMLLNGRLDLIMLADAYIRSVMTDEVRGQLLISERPYSTHRLSAVTNPQKAIHVDELNKLLVNLQQDGELADILRRNGL